MNEHACSAILFDLDGTLIDTGGLYERHWRTWAAARGIDPDPVVALHFGRAAAETIRLVAPDLDAVAEAASYNAELARDPDSSGVQVIDGASRLLASLPADRWAIVTSATRSWWSGGCQPWGCPCRVSSSRSMTSRAASRRQTPISGLRSSSATTPHTAWSWRMRRLASRPERPPGQSCWP